MGTDETEIYLGLMSGTSLDGLDLGLVEFSENTPIKAALLACRHVSFERRLRDRLLLLRRHPEAGLGDIGELDQILGRLCASACQDFIVNCGHAAAAIRAIGSHGLTLWHQPSGMHPFTWQIGDPNQIAELTGVTTVADFRRRDMAAGGQGAPLASGFHAALLAGQTESAAVVNIGGIANLTGVMPEGDTIGLDTGPGNTLLDAWYRTAHPNIYPGYDDQGRWAASGKPIPGLLTDLLDHPYFRRPAPRTTGPEEFHLDWLQEVAGTRLQACCPEDVQSTLSELTAVTIAQAITQYCPTAQHLYLCGGGAFNLDLVLRLQSRLPGIVVQVSDVIGAPAAWMEVMAFAWLARQALRGRPGNLPSVTGARHPVPLGAVYPGRLVRPA